mgnify:CR=1 FL=1
MRIEFDEINLRADMVGAANGITSREIKEAAPQAKRALEGFRKSYEDGRYGFPDLPSNLRLAKEIKEFAGQVQGTFDTVCLVGIGGSALGAWALDCALRGPHPVQGAFSTAHPRLVILDNVDPALTAAAIDSMNPRKTLTLVIAKSGSTAETIATFMVVREWMDRALGAKAARRIVAVTTQGRGELFHLAEREGYRSFPIPENVGGRFSVLSAVGLVPAALIGIDIRKLLRGAAAMTQQCWDKNLNSNPGLRTALLHYLIWRSKGKTIQVAFPYSNRLWGTAFWFRQLWAESLGKASNRSGETVNLGQTPVAALGTTDQHSQVQLYIEGPNDKVFTFWAVRKHPDPVRIPRRRYGMASFDYLTGKTLAELLEAERSSTAAALAQNGRPNCTYWLERVDEEHTGAFLQMLEFQTAFMGELLDVDAFNQPGVELGKLFTFGLMGRAGYESYREQFEEYQARRRKVAL